jgi:hypothetical protein
MSSHHVNMTPQEMVKAFEQSIPDLKYLRRNTDMSTWEKVEMSWQIS